MLRRLWAFAGPVHAGIAGALGLGVVTALAGVGLLAASAYLISKAALRPPVLELGLTIVAVRTLALTRAAGRYGERLAGHDLALRALGEIRVWFYLGLEPLAPAGLGGVRGGDLLARLTADVDALQDLLLRALQPLAVAALAAVAVAGAALSIQPAAGIVLAGILLVAGVLVPAAARRAGRGSPRATAGARGALATEVVDLLDGLPELVAFGRAGDHLARTRDADCALTRRARRAAFAEGLAAGLRSSPPGRLPRRCWRWRRRRCERETCRASGWRRSSWSPWPSSTCCSPSPAQPVTSRLAWPPRGACSRSSTGRRR